VGDVDGRPFHGRSAGCPIRNSAGAEKSNFLHDCLEQGLTQDNHLSCAKKMRPGSWRVSEITFKARKIHLAVWFGGDLVGIGMGGLDEDRETLASSRRKGRPLPLAPKICEGEGPQEG